MRLAIPTSAGRISPVFDVAERLLLVDINDGLETHRQEEQINITNPMQRTMRLTGLGVNLLICEAISRPLEMMLVAAGVQVIPQTCGSVEEVIRAFVTGQLTERSFLMPGCCRRRRCLGPQQGGRVENYRT